MRWNEIEKLITENPDCELDVRYYVHRIERCIMLNDYNRTRWKLTAPQFIKAASFYFEDEPYVNVKKPDGNLMAHQIYRRKK